MAIDLLSGTGYLLVIGAVILCIGGLGIYLLWRKSQYRHVFRLFNTDLTSSRIIKARIKTDESNKKYQYYHFKENNTRLSIESPNNTEEGKPIRYITYDENGDFIYLSTPKLNKDHYIEYSLKPTHKTLYLQMLKDNQSKYPLFNKALMLSYGALILIGLMIVVGFIYTFATNVKQGNQLVELSQQNQEVVNSMNGISKSLVDSSNSIYAAVSLLYNGTINRPLQGFTP